MRMLAWRGVRHNLGRYIATLVAIVTGVGFFAATGFVSDGVISSLEGDVDRRYGNVDVAVVLEDSGITSAPSNRELRIPESQARRIVALPGVEGSAGELSAPVAFPPRAGHPGTKAVTGRLWIDDAELNPLELTSGKAPANVGEIAVDEGLAESEDLQVGSKVKIASLGGQFDATVTGVTKFGSSDSQDPEGTVSLPRAAAFEWLNEGREEYQAIYLRGSVTERDVAGLVPRGYQAQSGADFLADQREQIGAVGRYLKYALQAFALLALFVGGFVIYNTFNVIVAQRMRELAVLAAIGATPKQIKRSLGTEGLLLGVIGSALGVAAGFLLAWLLIGILKLIGVELPGGGVLVSPATVIQGLVLGTLITVFSVRMPARRAAKVEPIEAMRSAAVDQTTFRKRRKIAAAGLLLLGAAALVGGGSWVLIALGVLLLFIGAVVSGPFLALFGARLARPVLSRFGLEGRLAVDNTARNPQRTATTANALLIGVFLVTLVTAAGTSVKDFAVDEIRKLDSADYFVSSQGGTIDTRLQDELKTIDGVNSVTPFQRAPVTIDNDVSRLSAGDLAAMAEVSDLKFTRGSAADIRPGTIAVPDTDGHPELGATVTVANNEGKSERLEVVALIEQTIDSPQVGALTAPESFDALIGDAAPTVAIVDIGSGDQERTEDAINARADTRPDITVEAGNAIGKIVGSVFDFVINAINGLLGMSVIVALIGIVNTLSLSILERRRELGLLRVVGMVDKRVQRMVRLESVVITAIGTLSGVLLGLFAAWGLVFSIDRLADADIGFSFPAVQMVVVLVAGLALGLLASIIPARRSTRLDVLEAIQAT
ncbi:ABC transporter permease [Solirubrobacter taibaiensis]|nr:ABC transporter permease [Solirubrobacter taibaiensis]